MKSIFSIMTTAKVPFCTDEELLDELKKLGYSDVSSDVFEMMKDDLSDLVSKEQFNPKSSITESRKVSASTGLKYCYTPNKFNKTSDKAFKSDQPEAANNHGNFSDREVPPASLKYRYPTKRFLRAPKVFSEPEKTDPPEAVINSEDTNSSGLSSTDDGTNISTSSFDKYKDIFKNYKNNSYPRKIETLSTKGTEDQEHLSAQLIHDISSDYGSSSSSVTIGSNKIKRKVLRHREGKPVITEEFLDIPSIFNSSYPETQTLDNSKSFSSDDLSWKSNSSTGSMAAISPDAANTPRSTLSSTRSLQSRLVNPRKKKSDPVAMYNYYKKFWNEFKPPGEKTHDKIRWAVRDKMLEYNL